jgi:hypothetical protein
MVSGPHGIRARGTGGGGGGGVVASEAARSGEAAGSGEVKAAHLGSCGSGEAARLRGSCWCHRWPPAGRSSSSWGELVELVRPRSGAVSVDLEGGARCWCWAAAGVHCEVLGERDCCWTAGCCPPS